jgi:hypothetical protein
LEEDEKRMRSEIDGRGKRGGEDFVDDKPVTYTLCVCVCVCLYICIYVYMFLNCGYGYRLSVGCI